MLRLVNEKAAWQAAPLATISIIISNNNIHNALLWSCDTVNGIAANPQTACSCLEFGKPGHGALQRAAWLAGHNLKTCQRHRCNDPI